MDTSLGYKLEELRGKTGRSKDLEVEEQEQLGF
jgi:hypothetical protein